MAQNTHNVINISTQDSFHAYLEQSTNKPILIDFFAEWCGPCKMIAPRIQQLSNQYPHVQFLKIDVDKLQSLSQLYQIRAMPTFVLIKNKLEISRTQGADINKNMDQLNTLSANIETVLQYKQNGNEAYSKHQNMNGALHNYQTALKMLKSLSDFITKYKDLFIKLHCNIALMYLKLGGNDNYNNCIRHCNEVLRKGIAPYNQKAFLRKGEAFMSMKQYKNAKSVYSQYMKYDPDNQEMKSKWTEAKTKFKQERSNKL